LINGNKLGQKEVTPERLQPPGGQAKGKVFEETNYGRRYAIMLGTNSESKKDYPKTVVPQGYCFVMTDNRDHGMDSRDFSFVAVGDVIGRVQYIFLPAATWFRFGKIWKFTKEGCNELANKTTAYKKLLASLRNLGTVFGLCRASICL
jgi:hypothetical protein